MDIAKKNRMFSWWSKRCGLKEAAFVFAVQNTNALEVRSVENGEEVRDGFSLVEIQYQYQHVSILYIPIHPVLIMYERTCLINSLSHVTICKNETKGQYKCENLYP